ncbi:DMT family transporter [Lactobacillus pasteurii]|uniref:DMT family drug/metabolite exporter n=1 Tax=Lactobacillus pasteurii DSM 23907 = CRBIP 24.76 TaxID=1423790 RepID=I7LBY3_9LACO|nr:DMT family transporter [Lactobacillus pasteurii]TDG76270.1 hypothetical protein C5L33_001029 [Lactobacillus pasteurii]CCI86006.1 DMT family drug/metabolite exporter [Lactobacillus pasteurii DSM 23907 = CRBIP 24.76]
MDQNNQVVKGMAWAGLASLSWGVSGTVLQLISQDLEVPGPWMFSTRTTITGLILLLIGTILYKGRIFDVFKTRKSCISVFAYGLLGLAANLMTFYYSIQTGNASTATILQYLSPLFIVLGGVVFYRHRPMRTDVLAFVIALIGVLLCITKGDLTHLAVPMVSLLWGIGSGITAALYVVLPQKASKENPPILVLGWGTMIAGIFFNFLNPMWVNVPKITPTLVGSVATVIMLGTIVPFGLLLHASCMAPSDVVSIMDALQPITTTLLSVIFFKLDIGAIEILGIVLVLGAIYILQYGRKPRGVKQNQ